MNGALPEKWLPGGAYYEEAIAKIESTPTMTNLDWLPKIVIDEGIATAWLKSSKYGLCCIPKSALTKKVCFTALVKSGSDIYYVPEEILDRELAELAIKNGAMIEAIPSNFVDEDLFLLYLDVHQDVRFYASVPNHLKTEKVCTELYRRCPSMMASIPEELQLTVYETGVICDFKSGWAAFANAQIFPPPPLLVRQ